MIINSPGQTIGAQMVTASSGAAYVGTVTAYVTIDAGTQALGTVGNGICTAEGNGYYTYRPSQSETNGALIAFTFIGAGAVPATVQVATVSASQQATLSSLTGSTSKKVVTLITDALKRINVLQENESPGAAMMTDAFSRFNDFIDSVCANDRLLIAAVKRTTWTLTSSKGVLGNPYTVGVGGDINIPRPSYVDFVRYQDTSVTPTLEYPLTPLTDDGWALIPQKGLTSPLPTSYYYNPTFDSGAFGSLYLWLVPTQTTLQGVMYYPEQVSSFNSVNDTIALPPGYNRFLRDNLAVELASEFRENIPIDIGLINSAKESKRLLQMKNVRMMDMALDAAILPVRTGRYNINSDGTY